MFAVALLASPVLAQRDKAPEPGWTVAARNGCKVWNSAPQPRESMSSSAACIKGFAEGEWKSGKPDEEGTHRAADGRAYAGLWKNGCFSQGGQRNAVLATPKECGFTKWSPSRVAERLDAPEGAQSMKFAFDPKFAHRIAAGAEFSVEGLVCVRS